MRSMVEGAGITAALGIRPLHRLRRSPSPAFAGEEPAFQRQPIAPTIMDTSLSPFTMPGAADRAGENSCVSTWLGPALFVLFRSRTRRH